MYAVAVQNISGYMGMHVNDKKSRSIKIFHIFVFTVYVLRACDDHELYYWITNYLPEYLYVLQIFIIAKICLFSF